MCDWGGGPLEIQNYVDSIGAPPRADGAKGSHSAGPKLGVGPGSLPGVGGAPQLVPLSLAQARRYVADHHRHNEPPRGHKFSIGLSRDGELVGVVIAGRPVARGVDDGVTIELIRVTTEGERNACSRLYSAACRAAKAMGYRRAITYTLADETGASLRTSGFVQDGETKGGEWTPAVGVWRQAEHPRMFDPPKMPTGRKTRWVRVLS